MGTTTTTKTTKDNWEKEIIMSIFSMVDNDLPGNLDKNKSTAQPWHGRLQTFEKEKKMTTIKVTTAAVAAAADEMGTFVTSFI